ncbi:MAG: hypothetical protein M3O67_03960 [Bacteroidota bacterium]|nr:hypothetical protein [Bacteroidota bacterium]
MKEYNLVLKNEKLKTYDSISWLVITLNFFAFVYIGYLMRGYNASKWPIIGASLILLSLLFFWVKKKTKRRQLISFSSPLFFALFTWVQLKNYWLAAAILLLIIFQELAKRKLEVIFFMDKIVYPSFPQKIIQWRQLNNVILKDGLLTIDFKNDKLIQARLENENEFDENDFNKFCDTQINKRALVSSDSEK